MNLPTCTWCGHVHDPEDGRCDAPAHVGIGACPCPGDTVGSQAHDGEPREVDLRARIDRTLGQVRYGLDGKDDWTLADSARAAQEVASLIYELNLAVLYERHLAASSEAAALSRIEERPS